MKFTFYCLLGLFLITNQTDAIPSSHRGIEIVLNTVFGQVSSLYKQIQLVILQLSNVAEAGIRQIEEDFIKAAINISDLVNDFGDSARQCIKKYWKSLEIAKAELKSNILECSKSVKKQGTKITDILQKQQREIEESSKAFYETINECLEFKSGQIVECIFYKMGELKNIASRVTLSTEQSLKKSVDDTSKISKEGNECIRGALDKFAQIQKNTSSKIRDCVKDSWTDYY
ncbi:uncharacterized protein LOC129611914 [Condylostylus longicornis]|uniref:uncharacterized protein LOC129611914 n=1 Tax=Condylostylus longicornis TaxID=2530218 RepID=UPI00244DD201|nr:uncharacterized protein LOC129611914 [Condylostylus longicornis]